MMKHYFFFLLFFGGTLNGFSQELSTIMYRDTTIPFIELNTSKYDFVYPICSNILDSTSFDPPTDGVYTLATYGHRYLSSTSNKSDNHGGFDYWRDHLCNGVMYDEVNKTPISCMCDGVISDVIDGLDSLLDLTATGRSVQVTCDSLSQAFPASPIKINYRHLSGLGSLAAMADTSLPNTITISKGDTIGFMGESGTTTNVHLHMSTITTHPVEGNRFTHTARLFDPTLAPHVLGTLSEAKIKLLHDWPDSALFRISYPFNATINQFEFKNEAFSFTFNKEEAYDTGSAVRDNHDCIPGVKVYAYQFNGKQTAASRYSSEQLNMPARYPASPQRDTNSAMYGYAHIPITLDSIWYVYDFLVENLPPVHDKDSFVVKLSDVWGYSVKGSFDQPLNIKETPASISSMKISPNPTDGIISISFPEVSKRQIEVLDVHGNQLQIVTGSGAKQTIDISLFPKGTYFLRASSKEKVEIRKVIKD